MAILEENDILFAHKAITLMAGVTDATKRVAGAIIDHFNKRTGQCDPGIERLATMLGVNRATVIRATETLHELGLIDKASHGGKAHRASYAPNWDRFRAIVEEWDARMKTGAGPSAHTTEAGAKVAAVQRSQSQGCDVKGRTLATQTLRSNPSNKPVEAEQVETQAAKPPAPRPERPSQGLGKGSRPDAQRSFIMPITGGRNTSHADAAKAAAERRWYSQLHSLGERAEASVLDWITTERQEAATMAEIRQRGGGLAFVLSAMQGEGMRAHG